MKPNNQNQKVHELDEKEQQEVNGGTSPVNPYVTPIDDYGPSDTDPWMQADSQPSDPSAPTQQQPGDMGSPSSM